MERYKSKYQENKQKLKEEVYISELQEIVRLINNVIQKLPNSLGNTEETSLEYLIRIENLIEANKLLLANISYDQQSLNKETV
jgi:hypothetical protein